MNKHSREREREREAFLYNSMSGDWPKICHSVCDFIGRGDGFDDFKLILQKSQQMMKLFGDKHRVSQHCQDCPGIKLSPASSVVRCR